MTFMGISMFFLALYAFEMHYATVRAHNSNDIIIMEEEMSEYLIESVQNSLGSADKDTTVFKTPNNKPTKVQVRWSLTTKTTEKDIRINRSHSPPQIPHTPFSDTATQSECDTTEKVQVLAKSDTERLQDQTHTPSAVSIQTDTDSSQDKSSDFSTNALCALKDPLSHAIPCADTFAFYLQSAHLLWQELYRRVITFIPIVQKGWRHAARSIFPFLKHFAAIVFYELRTLFTFVKELLFTFLESYEQMMEWLPGYMQQIWQVHPEIHPYLRDLCAFLLLSSAYYIFALLYYFLSRLPVMLMQMYKACSHHTQLQLQLFAFIVLLTFLYQLLFFHSHWLLYCGLMSLCLYLSWCVQFDSKALLRGNSSSVCKIARTDTLAGAW